MAGDISWKDMPEELALQLYDFSQKTPSEVTRSAPKFMGELQEWLEENIDPCKAEPFHVKDVPAGSCQELPVPGSEFCPVHMPREDAHDV